jgi:hypothetical protein
MATNVYFSGSNQINIDLIVNMASLRKQEQLSAMPGRRSLEVRGLTFLGRGQEDGARIGRGMAEILPALCEKAASLAAGSEFTMSLGS